MEMDSPYCARVEGFSLHGQVLIPAGQRDRLEGLCRYIARPPVANARLSLLPDGKLCYELKRPWSDGTSHVVFEPLELLEKWVALMPRPWTHLVRYHGVFAPNARLRSKVVPGYPSLEAEEQAPCDVGTSASGTEQAHVEGDEQANEPVSQVIPTRAQIGGKRRALPWAELMRRVFMIDVLCCGQCGHSMTIVSVLTDVDVVEPFLACLGLPPHPPHPAPARAPPWP